MKVGSVGVVAARTYLIATKLLGALHSCLLQRPPNPLIAVIWHDTECNNLGFDQCVIFEMDRRSLFILAQPLHHEAQEADGFSLCESREHLAAEEVVSLHLHPSRLTEHVYNAHAPAP